MRRHFTERFRKEAGEQAGSAAGSHVEAPSEDERALVCSGCRHVVTHESRALKVADRHRHTCVNPAGIVFRVRCFSTAPGCVGHGEVSTYFSWFAGYAWQIALCERCTMHLGWSFSGATPPFWGLIADRILREA